MLENIRIVLVNTSHPGNIGGVARAMKNMGVSDLVLVEPKEFPSDVAVARASGATDVLDQANVVASLEEAVADCGLVVGTSARSRHIPWPLVDPRQAAAITHKSNTRVAFVFGREDRGLTNEELSLCHHHVHIPTNEDFSSLNIAAAVQVIVYELRMAARAEQVDEALPNWGTDWDVDLADHGEMERMFAHLEETLVDIEFLDPKNPRQLMPRLRRLFMRALVDKIEVNVLRGILTSVQKAAGTHGGSGNALKKQREQQGG